MKSKKMSRNLAAGLFAILASTCGGASLAAVSAEEAKRLGGTLTLFGAEKAGNKEGSIPEYTGGLTKLPANYVPGSGVRPDPFAEEKPLFSITAQNMSQYADKLAEGLKVLLKKFPTFRMDVYPAHRTVAYPDFVLKNTGKNATRARTENAGLTMVDARGGVPFPMPKDGYEVMWNHNARYLGRAAREKATSILVDSNGRKITASVSVADYEFPYFDEKPSKPDATRYYKASITFVGPARNAGQLFLVLDDIDSIKVGRISYQYLPGQRRVKLMPELSFDGPDLTTAGNSNWDEHWMFNGSMERFNMKLLDKKAMYVPYNTYKAAYGVTREQLLGPHHENPDVYRWELHRVWVVEGTLKPGKRHAYPRRVFYVDEDSWTVLVSENYDAQGSLVKVLYAGQAPLYDLPACWAGPTFSYNLMTNNYLVNDWLGEGGYRRGVPLKPDAFWTPGAMSGGGIR